MSMASSGGYYSYYNGHQPAPYYYGYAQPARVAGGGLMYLLAQLMGMGDGGGSPYGRWHGGGGGASSSPWGVALVLVLVLFLVSYQSSFQSWWFPLLSRR